MFFSFVYKSLKNTIFFFWKLSLFFFNSSAGKFFIFYLMQEKIYLDRFFCHWKKDLQEKISDTFYTLLCS